MGNKYKNIVNEINDFCDKVIACDISNAYIGITKDPQRRLFGEHKITNKEHWWICCKAEDEDTARAVEHHFIRMGMKGGTGGGDNKTVYVYCFARRLQ